MKRTLLALSIALSLAFNPNAQAPSNPFMIPSADSRLIHIMPIQDVMRKLTTRQELTGTHAGNSTVYPSPYGPALLTDQGDPEITNAAVQAVYWNTAVANSTATSLGYATVKDQIDAFISAFSNGVNWRDTSTADYTIIQQYGSHATISPMLIKLGYYVDSQPTQASITDAAIQTYLAGRFDAGVLSPGVSTIYAVFFPPGMSVTIGTSASCQVFCGYHSSFTYHGMRIIYAPIAYLDCSGCPFNLNDGVHKIADQLTDVLSHETRESITDTGNSWWDSNPASLTYGYEADDKCNGSHTYQMSNGGFWVQPEWSNGGTVRRSGFTATYPGPGCIVPDTLAPSITTQPQSQTITSGQTANFNVVASGTALSYQWYVGTSPTTTNPVGGSSSNFTTPALTSTTSYWVRVSNTRGAADSSTATITVAPLVTTQPQSKTIASGQTSSLGVLGSGSVPIGYQWYIGTSGTTTIPISGATSSSYTTPALTSTTRYWARVSNAYGSANSNTATISVAFGDDPLSAGSSVIRVVHIMELRTRIGTLRARFSLPAFAWTDPSLTVGATVVRAVHLTELRTALSQAYVAAGLTPPTYTTPSLVAGTTVRVAHIAEIRAAVEAIE